jgi:uncharacterized linocin/CFP29 family protein
MKFTSEAQTIINNSLKLDSPLTEFQKHLIHYAKGSYQVSTLDHLGEGKSFYDDLIQMTESIFKKNRELTFIEDEMAETILRTCDKDTIKGILSLGFNSLDPAEYLQSMISALRKLKIKDGESSIIWDIGVPDPEVLPLSVNTD